MSLKLPIDYFVIWNLSKAPWDARGTNKNISDLLLLRYDSALCATCADLVEYVHRKYSRMVSRGIWNRFIKISWAVKWWVMFRGFWNIASWYLVHFIQRETMLFLFIQNTTSNNMLQRNLPITFQTFLIPWCNLGNSLSLIWVLKHCGTMLKFYLNGEYMGTQSNETSLQVFNSIIYLQATI